MGLSKTFWAATAILGDRCSRVRRRYKLGGATTTSVFESSLAVDRLWTISLMDLIVPFLETMPCQSVPGNTHCNAVTAATYILKLPPT